MPHTAPDGPHTSECGHPDPVPWGRGAWGHPRCSPLLPCAARGHGRHGTAGLGARLGARGAEFPPWRPLPSALRPFSAPSDPKPGCLPGPRCLLPPGCLPCAGGVLISQLTFVFSPNSLAGWKLCATKTCAVILYKQVTKLEFYCSG